MAKKPTVMDGQLSVLDVIGIVDKLLKDTSHYAKVKASSAKLSIEEYLQKGVRIESLAREAFSKEMAGLTLSDFEKKLFGVEIPEGAFLDSVVQTITKKVVNPILKSSKDYGQDSEIMRFFKNFIDFDFDLRLADESYSHFASYNTLRRKWKKSTDQIVLTVREDGNYFTLFGYRGSNIPKNMRQRIWRDGVRNEMFGDVGETLTWMIIFTQYNRLLSDMDKRVAVEEAVEGRLDPPNWLLTSAIDKDSNVFGDIYDAEHVTVNFEDRFKSIDRRCSIVISDDNAPCDKAVEDLLQYAGIQKSYIASAEEAFPYARELTPSYMRRTNGRTARETGGMRPNAYILTKRIELCMATLEPVKAFDNGYGKIKILNCFSKHSSGQMMSTIHIGWLDTTVRSVIELAWTEKRNIINSYNYYNSLSKGEHARSFQTKKQHIQKYVESAKSSELNERFGFIEFDEAVDLENVSIVTEQIKAFVDGYLNKLDLSGVALRFRKLGNHKASGLYYPGHRCICVDIHSPSSFVHELGHCIDHVASSDINALSEKSSFYPIWHKYSYLLSKAYFEVDSTKKERLSGSSKYNMAYYKTKTEVFARCFEMYVVRVLGFDNSICKQDSDDSFAYPKDEKLDELIKGYFDELFNQLHDDTTGDALEAA